MEICLEDLSLAEDDERYIRCVALPGGEPGLALDREGEVRWMPDERASHGLWVSADDRLVLLRGEEAGPIRVERGGRSLDAPVDRPVILLDQDLLRVNGRRLLVHVHGATEVVFEPEPLTRSALGRVARAAATALAIGAAVGVGNVGEAHPADTGIEVRLRPPKKVAMRKVVCKITAMKLDKQGQLTVYAACPKDETITKGARGQLLDPGSGAPMTDGAVTVQAVTKSNKVRCESKLKKRVKAKQVRFYVRM
jgi:hypothetical protein